MILQKTIRASVVTEGVGLHTGEQCHLILRPALPNTGVVFVRQKGKGYETLPALSEYIVDTRFASTLGKGEFRISTVEHCLCAVSALRIDNLILELVGPEIPIQDGSSLFFLEALKKVGLVEQPVPRKYWVIHSPIEVVDGERWARVEPYPGLRLSVTIDFPHPQIGQQTIDLDINEVTFSQEIAAARTFGFLKDAERLQAQGLARGGSLRNAIILDDNAILNPEGLRWPDEFVRHKALDALGDLSLLGAPLMGYLKVFKAGHDLMAQLVKKITNSPQCSRLQEMAFDISK
ncbi:MAG: UDP-3-O-acyl-N-acetylglucosamine deacetylase [Bdellovibrionaceae bacterium]|nr:UDP-3-O-acyl-N-acetylglucosamine deacetylase [Pseudobdellovibrionaceae bacterium]MDW8190232.1 UDP-3-O-acyl-N-acetylglucosamine deacetylase [Pseudobdellovibrionaceae bacterium]